MIKMFTAFTEEADDAEFAVSEILEQLNLDGLLAESVGIVHCHVDFVDGGVVSALGEKLPFDIVGCSTLSVSSSGNISPIALGITVLTSDDVRFAAGVSRPIGDDLDGPLAELYGRLIAPFSEKPSLLVPFIPFMMNIGGDEFIEKLDGLSGGLPAFGTLASTHEVDLSKNYTFHNGESFSGSLVLLALIGDARPDFFSVAISPGNILKQKAVITGMNRNILQTVNDMSAVKYLESIGLVHNGVVSGLESMPFIVYLEDGSQLVRACVGATEDGGAILCGSAPVNSTFALSSMNFDDVVNSTGAKVAETLSAANGRGLLMYSCCGRNWALGVKTMAEHEKVKECVKDAAPYHFAYSAGEIFPERLSDGSIVNHLQNDSLIICVL
ncbi:MAG: FIST C-terminal domain-containing protein [Synergistaceae bacterium]|nr:FIST C-terminal domain-containing protein [Synergistaceae bacterium]